MAKKVSKSKTKRKDKGRLNARKHAKAQAQVDGRISLSIVHENRSKMNVEKHSDVAPIPTDKNGNSHSATDSV